MENTQMKHAKSKEIFTIATLFGAMTCALPSHAQMASLDLAIGSIDGTGPHYNILYTPANSSFFESWVWEKTPDGKPTHLYFNLGNPGTSSQTPWLNLNFSTTQLGQPLEVGTYTDAERASFASPGHPGFDISFNHYGDNAVWGSFSIDKISFSVDGRVEYFSSRFEAFGSGFYGVGSATKYTGIFTYNAIPEPSIQLLFATGIAGLMLFKKSHQIKRTGQMKTPYSS